MLEQFKLIEERFRGVFHELLSIDTENLILLLVSIFLLYSI